MTNENGGQTSRNDSDVCIKWYVLHETIIRTWSLYIGDRIRVTYAWLVYSFADLLIEWWSTMLNGMVADGTCLDCEGKYDCVGEKSYSMIWQWSITQQYIRLRLVRSATTVFDTIVEGEKKPENGFNRSRVPDGKVFSLVETNVFRNGLPSSRIELYHWFNVKVSDSLILTVMRCL